MSVSTTPSMNNETQTASNAKLPIVNRSPMESSIVVKDIFEELTEENKRLINELSFAKKCINSLIEYKTFVELISRKFKPILESNELQKFENLDKNVNQIVFNLDLRTDYIQWQSAEENVVNEKIIEEIEVQSDIDENENKDIKEENSSTDSEAKDKSTKDSEPKRILAVNMNRIVSTTHECYVCRKKFADQSLLDRHISEHPMDKSYLCPEPSCQFHTVMAKSLQEHMKCHLYCKTCDQSFENNSQVKQHFLDIHQKPVLQNSRELFALKDGHNKHMRVTFKCGHCDKAFYYRTILKEHIKLVHSSYLSLNQPIVSAADCRPKHPNNKSLPKRVTLVPKPMPILVQKTVIDKVVESQEQNNPIDSIHNEVESVLRNGTTYESRSKKRPNDNNIEMSEEVTERQVDARQVVSEEKPNVEKRHVCQHQGCDQHFQYQYQLRDHQNIHTGKRPYVCYTCKESFAETDSLKSHLESHNEKALHCTHKGCEYKTSIVQQLEQHVKQHITESENKCDICQEVFAKKSHLKHHMSTHRALSDQTFVCGIDGCTKQYRYGTSLNNHKKLHHLVDKRFVCPHNNCQFKAATEAQLTLHLKNHIGTSDRPFKCHFPGCAKSFKSDSCLKYHVLMHGKERRNKCPREECGKTFLTFKTLNTHMKESHSNVWYRCDWPGCEYSCCRKIGIKTHSVVHSNELPFACDWPQCGRRFKRRNGLIEHLRIHKGEKLNVCHWPGCQYRCTHSGNLGKHMRKHLKK